MTAFFTTWLTRRSRVTALLALLAAGGLLYSQFAALSPAHEHHTLADKCAICHAGHLPIVSPPPPVAPEPAAVLIAVASVEQVRHPRSNRFDRHASRAPPFALFA